VFLYFLITFNVQYIPKLFGKNLGKYFIFSILKFFSIAGSNSFWLFWCSSLFLKPIIASIPMALVITLIQMHVVATIIFGAVTYIVILKIVGGLKKEYFQLYD